MKLSDIFNVDLDLYSRNKDYSKYKFPSLSKIFGISFPNYEEIKKFMYTRDGSYLRKITLNSEILMEIPGSFSNATTDD